MEDRAAPVRLREAIGKIRRAVRLQEAIGKTGWASSPPGQHYREDRAGPVRLRDTSANWHFIYSNTLTYDAVSHSSMYFQRLTLQVENRKIDRPKHMFWVKS